MNFNCNKQLLRRFFFFGGGSKKLWLYYVLQFLFLKHADLCYFNNNQTCFKIGFVGEKRFKKKISKKTPIISIPIDGV